MLTSALTRFAIACALVAGALMPETRETAGQVLQAGVPKSAALFMGTLLLIAPRIKR